MAVSFVKGVQTSVIASAKHFAANSIENTRFNVDVHVDERTLREVYLPHFQSVVEAGVGSIMSAYNKVNGVYCGENTHLLHDILKGEWRFDGFVESDWILGTRSTAPAVLAGLDIEMPTAKYFGQALVDAVNAGEVSERAPSTKPFGGFFGRSSGSASSTGCRPSTPGRSSKAPSTRRWRARRKKRRSSS
jgi:beta-glucosidase